MFTPEKPPVDNTPLICQTRRRQKRHKIEVNLKPVVHNVSTSTMTTSAADAKPAKKLADERRKAFAAAARAIKDNASTATSVEMPGSSSVSYASYASVVRSIYDRYWTDPGNAASDNSDVHVSVTIGADGHRDRIQHHHPFRRFQRG